MEGQLKVNTDAAFWVGIDGAGQDGAGAVVWDWNRQVLAVAAMQLRHVQDVEHADMLGVLLGMELVRRLGVEVFCMECGSANLVRRLKRGGRDLSLLGTLIHHFRTQVHSLLSIEHVKRDQNTVADRLASLGSSLNELLFVFDNLLQDSVMAAVLADVSS